MPFTCSPAGASSPPAGPSWPPSSNPRATSSSPDNYDRPMTTPAGWEVRDGKLHREFTFTDFSAAWAFMNRVALAAEKAGHHPDWSNSWNKVAIDLVSHDARAITERDVNLAEA